MRSKSLRTLFIGLILLLSFISCAEQKQVEENTKVDLQAIANKLLEAFNNQDAEAYAKLYTEDQITIVPTTSVPVQGREAKEEMLAGVFQAFPDLVIEHTLILYSDDYIVVEGVMKGTHTGPFESPGRTLPPTGNNIEIRNVFILKVTPEGFIAQDNTYFDTFSYMRQLGLL
jgi:steroid delta-isomerase-like uncharacterized protein